MNSPTDTTPLPADVRPPPRRHRARKALLIVGGALTALILLIVVISVATSKSGTPTAAGHSTTPTALKPSAPAAQSYASTAGLLAAMAAHGATCSGVSL